MSNDKPFGLVQSLMGVTNTTALLHRCASTRYESDFGNNRDRIFSRLLSDRGEIRSED
ncbi:hypothetical protein [Tolypothrix sp. VBCCA 56010]|uniref:hypothetical protein n=1 Tax=Tolypothrix sp. VBCCA 56010 TaxID=3137731 RepID=UPI003D7ECE74